MEKSIIKLSSKEDLSIFWREMPENCVIVQKQYKGDWVGSYDSEIWLICKDKDDVVAEYSLENISQPIGIAQYELTKVLSKEFESSLPTIEEIEEELSE